ncbi:MAG: maltose alpha-D-glucosyltransferase [Nitrospirota bacterium]|nr:maltose alpha-D-glucosyltransferase [Nitrospirota bacterium]
MFKRKRIELEDNPLWYKDAVIYQTHVKSFCDSNADGIGDFPGLTRKLDYLEGLGITAIWILPFYPSPLRDDGYDIATYFAVHPDYGTMADFKAFLREAHKRGIRVIIELVLNHTSDQHPWFQQARRAPVGSIQRNYYVWNDSPEKYQEARIIFKDFETSNWSWDPVAKAYYWHRFYSHQPDLNFESPFVQRAVLKIMHNWLDLGVDGLRLDAIPYLYERDGTNCENLPETHAFLQHLRSYIDGKYKNRMLLGEANQWPEDAAAYFGNGDECHMAFHFPVMPRIFMALQMEDRFPIIDILEQTPRIPETCQWAMFLRNHDELTLEMVTDEERDYMYRVYARDQRTRINLGIRRRLAPLIGNSRRKIELMNILLFSLPGTPVIYYGDEIGMGDNYYLGDRNGVRTPMQWSADRNAGFSQANPQRLYLPVIIDPEYHYEAVNVDTQERNTSSLLWWMKRVIAMRKRYKAFTRGETEFAASDNPKVLAFVRSFGDERILVVINLSRFSQMVELDLAAYSGHVPIEVFSQNRFPLIKDSPYVLTMGIHDYFWFVLQKETVAAGTMEERRLPELAVKASWTAVLEGRQRTRLEEDALPAYLRSVRWFGGKARNLQRVKIIDTIPLDREESAARILLLETFYTEGVSDTYLLPLAFAAGDRSAQIAAELPHASVARLSVDDQPGLLYDAVYDESFRANLLKMMAAKRRIHGRTGQMVMLPGRRFRSLTAGQGVTVSSQVLKAEQSNTSILYENTLILKLYRRLDEGLNPDPEIVRFLTERAGFEGTPAFGGSIEFLKRGAEPMVMGHLQQFVPNEGDAWTYTLDAVHQFFERVLSEAAEGRDIPSLPSSLLDMNPSALPKKLQDLIGGIYLDTASVLGRRTGQLHKALARGTGDPAFEAEPISTLYQRSVYQSMRNQTRRVMQLLQKNAKKLPEDLQKRAAALLGNEKDILSVFQSLLASKVTAVKTRFHGDFHLGQVLRTGKDFYIIDFEGEPARALSERRLKRSPIRDVAGMIRSFHYAAHSALRSYGSIRPEDIVGLEAWAEAWYVAVSGIYLNSYLFTVEDADFVPRDRKEFEVLLRCFLLEKAVYEVGYELNNRPDWVTIPMRGIERLLKRA